MLKILLVVFYDVSVVVLLLFIATNDIEYVHFAHEKDHDWHIHAGAPSMM